MPKTPRIPLGLKGLNTDIPSHSLPLEFFSGGNNMRPFNNALQGVNSFASESTITFAVSGESSAPTGIFDAAQFTPAGSEFFNIIALVKHADNSFKVKAFNEDGSVTTQVGVSDYTFTLSGNATLNKDETITQSTSGATAKVRYSTENSTTVKVYDLTGNWAMNNASGHNIKRGSTDLGVYVTETINHNTGTSTTSGNLTLNDNLTLGYDPEFNTDMFVFNECLILNSGKHKPLFLSSQGSKLAVFDNWPADVITGSTTEKLYSPKIAQYGGRLVALGLFGSSDIYNERSSVIFSSPITTMSSLAGVEWTVASTNSTVDDIITESPGPVIDGGQLGDNFIVYKSDCVISYREVTSSPFILGRVIQTDDGMISSKCFADIGNNQHIVFGNHNIYIHNGENQKQLISKNKVEDSLYAEINRTKIGQCFVFRHELDRETYFCIPTISHNGEGCNKAYVYAEETDSWYTRDLDNYTNIFTTEINGVVRMFGTKPTNVNLQELSTTAFVSGGTIEFTNNPLETSAITKTVTTAYPVCSGAVKIGLTSTDNIGDSSSITTKDFNPANDYKLSFRETGRYFDMKIEMNGTTNPEITGMEFNVNPRGAR